MNVEDAAVVPEIGNTELDLTKEEKLRTTALLVAVRYYTETIVKDGQMFQVLMAQGKNLEQCSVERVIAYAALFERYIRDGVVEVVLDEESRPRTEIEPTEDSR